MVFRNASSEFQTPRPAGVIAASSQKDRLNTLRGILSPPSWRLRTVQTKQDILSLLHREVVPVVLSDAELPDAGWGTLLESLDIFPAPPRLIVFSESADERLWAEVLNLGGYDLLLQPFDPGEVARVVDLACNDWRRESDGRIRRMGLSDAPNTRKHAKAAAH